MGLLLTLSPWGEHRYVIICLLPSIAASFHGEGGGEEKEMSVSVETLYITLYTLYITLDRNMRTVEVLYQDQYFRVGWRRGREAKIMMVMMMTTTTDLCRK